MLVKGFFICVQALLLDSVFTQCIGPSLYPGEGLYPTNLPFVERFSGLVAPLYGRVVGGNLIVDTSAPYTAIGPAGVSILSDDLLIEGAVIVTGNLPFLSTVALEGIVPAAGTSFVSHECRASNFGIVSAIPAEVIPAIGLELPRGIAGCNKVGLGQL